MVLKKILIMLVWVVFAATPAMAQTAQNDFTFQVDATDSTLGNVESPIDEFNEAEEDAAYAGDKSDIRDEEKPLEVEVLPPEALRSQPPAQDSSAASQQAEETKPDPCAAYTSARGKAVCEDRYMKIDRMNAARERRKTVYNGPTLNRDTAAETATEADVQAIAEEPAVDDAVNTNTTPTVSPPSTKVDSR